LLSTTVAQREITTLTLQNTHPEGHSTNRPQQGRERAVSAEEGACCGHRGELKTHGSVPVGSPQLLFQSPCWSPALRGHKDCTSPAGTTRDLTSTPTSCNYADSSLTKFLAIAMTAQVYRM